MKRKLLKQMITNWRSNIWLIVELIIVGSAMAGIMAIMFYMLNIRFQPSGYEVNDTYLITLDKIGSDSPEYIEYEDKVTQRNDEVYQLMSRVRALPEVELLGYGQNAMPYNGSYFGNTIRNYQDNDTVWFSFNYRYVSPEVPIILNLKGLNGETPKQLSKMIERGEIIATNTENPATGQNPSDYVGREFLISNDSSLYRFGAAIPAMKRSDFEEPGPSLLIPYDKSGKKISRIYEFIVKIKHGTDKKFINQIKDNPEQWRIGNLGIKDVSSMEQARTQMNRENNQTIIGMVVCCLFLLISIFLGQLGTFWFRTGQRTVEIAIRMVNGATNRQIFTRLITEGIILWSASLIFIAGLMYLVFKFDLLTDVIYDEMTKSIIYGTFISVVFLLIMIIVGIFFPARRATKIKPAIALKDE